MNSKIAFYMPPFPGITDYFKMIDAAESFGVSAVEGFNIMEFKAPDAQAAKRIREYADSKNVSFPCMSVYINVVEDTEKSTEILKGYADVAKILGSPYLHHTIVSEFSDPSGVVPFKDEFFEKGISVVRNVYDYCESIGIRAIYEEQGYLFNGIKGVERFLDSVKRDIGLVADFANICQSGDELTDYLNAYKGRFVHAHIKDVTLTAENETGAGLATLSGKYMNEVPVGNGEMKIKEGIEILRNSGYEGYYGIEYGAKEDGSSEILSGLELVDSLLK